MASEKALGKNPIGIFKGFTESGREFLAEMVTPYQPEFAPLLGSFILVKVRDDRALLGRITQFYPVGSMAGTEADEYLSHLQRLDQSVPEDVKELRLRYNVKVRLLGTVELRKNDFGYRPGVRTLPHLGASVCEPTDETLQFVCNARLEEEKDAVPIGQYALGDMQFPGLTVKFSFSRLLSKRTMVFARAGYGKSNLIKLLVSRLYEQPQKVGLLIFDPEGEYSFRDAQGLPGLADVPGVGERLVVFTDRRPPAPHYERVIAGSVRLNLTRIRASHVVDICLPEGRRNAVYATRLKGFRPVEWARLVELLHQEGFRLSEERIKTEFDIRRDPDAVIRNITPIVRRLHDPTCQLPLSVIYHLAQGHIVVVDISLLSSGSGQQVAGLILKTVFDHNVAHFTADDQDAVIPVVAILEEAQNVLSSQAMTEDSPFVEWAKEGRKYKLGAILVTQQPGAVSDQLLSQADNFFALHLVSTVDLDALQRNNAHFSNDILSYILNEPIEGNAYFWSAPSQPYVISTKLLDFTQHAKDRAKEAGEEWEEGIGHAVEDYAGLASDVTRLISNIVATDRKVPVYTPLRSGSVLEGFGAIRLINLQFRTGEKFFEDHPDITPWMLPEFFEVWDDNKVVLQSRYALELGDFVLGTKDGSKSAEYILVRLTDISFQNKTLKDTRVTLTGEDRQPES
jgi:hypothetical protein